MPSQLRVFLAFLSLPILCLISFPQETQASCSYIYGDWTSCNPSTQQQTRSISCLCQKRTIDLLMCKQLTPENTTRPCLPDSSSASVGSGSGLPSSSDESCTWKWTRWSRCSVECSSGNTTRSQVCVCTSGEGTAEVIDEDMCDKEDYYGNEVAECNEFDCTSVPSFNKIYWTKTKTWPIPDGTFNCTQSSPSTDSPRGLTYSTILSSDPTAHANKEWYYLAKEWVACTLNQANGALLPSSAASIYARISHLLEYCDSPIPVSTQELYALKEKLGRINNNIGGLQNVDEQIALYSANHGGVGGEAEALQSPGEAHGKLVMTPTLLIAVIISLAVLIVVVVVTIAVVYRYRQSMYSKVGKEEGQEQEEGMQGEGGEEMKDANELGGGGGAVTGADPTAVVEEEVVVEGDQQQQLPQDDHL